MKRHDVDLAWDLVSIAQGINGTLVGGGADRVKRVSIDTREPMEGALFVAIRGDRFNGHDYAAAAIAAGAIGVVVDERSATRVVPRIEVSDTGGALLALAAMRRAELDLPVVAVTGSTGKTSTKDLIAAGINGSWSSPKSHNNEIGVPLTVLATPPSATALVLEVGSRGPGHIRWLADAIKPDVSLVTNLGVVHLETFGSEQGLADAKFELVELLGDKGIAVLPRNETRLHRGGAHRTLTFGEVGSDVAIVDVSLDADGYPEITLEIADRTIEFRLSVAGAHQASNAAAAVAVALGLELDLDAFIRGMVGATGSAWRMDVHRGRYTVVNDAYNANPQSLASALATVSAMVGRSKIAVLGPMAELGPVCEERHRAMGEVARAQGFRWVVVVGPDHGYRLGAGDITLNATDLEEAADTLHAIVEPGDVVLVKASRSAGLERLALDLIEDAGR